MAYRCQVVKKVKFLNDQSIYWGNQLVVYRFIDDNKNIFGLRWLCKQFGISPNCYYNYKKDAKREYHKRLEHIFELIKYVYYNNNRVIAIGICVFSSNVMAMN